jgi:hypothetical protein
MVVPGKLFQAMNVSKGKPEIRTPTAPKPMNLEPSKLAWDI